MVTTHKRKRTMDQEKARRRISNIQRVMRLTRRRPLNSYPYCTYRPSMYNIQCRMLLVLVLVGLGLGLV
jgi:hypothetical protein